MAVGALALTATMQATAASHGTVSAADPGPGSVVEAVDNVLLQFDDALLDDGQFLVRIFDEDDQIIFVTGLRLEAPTVLVGKPDQTLPDGDYRLAYSVFFADGAHTEDAYSFRVDGSDAFGGRAVVIAGALLLAALGMWRLSRPRAIPASGL